MTRSIRMTSGASRTAASIASSPSAASPATAIPSWSSRNARRPSRTTAWSSTTSTRIGSATADLEPDGGSRAVRGADLERGAEPLRALLHRRQPEPARADGGGIRVEADAVVGDLEQQAPVTGLEDHGDVGRVRVAKRVLERLLGDPEHLAVARRFGGDVAGDRQVDLAAPEPADELDVLSQRAREAVPLEVGGPELEHERAQLVERLLRERLERRHLGARRGRVAVEQRRGRLGPQHETEQLLADRVVEVEREPVPLGGDRQLARALVEARVRDRDRGVRGEESDQLLVLGAEL